jgi:hypothetical protein
MVARTMLVAVMAMTGAGAALAQAPVQRPSAPMDDIRDIRGPKPIFAGWGLALLLAGAVAGAGAACAAWALLRRRRILERTPQEIALARLHAARALIRDGNSREYSIELSSITREYIENVFGIVATHFTTDEFLRHCANMPDSVLIGSRKLLGEFLEACDLAKFGGWNMTASGMLEMLEGARHFIVESARPRALTSMSNPTSPIHPVAIDDSRETYDSLPST